MDLLEAFARDADVAERALDGLSDPLRDLLTQLLLYKSVLMGAWFGSLASHQEDPRVRGTLLSMQRETVEQAAETIRQVREWDAVPGGARTMEDTRYAIRTRLLEDLLALKEGGVETSLAAGMRAPTDALRRKFTDLADIDRRHGDELRRLLGVQGVAGLARRHASSDVPGEGAHEGRFDEGPLYRSVQATLNRLVRGGHVPSRLLLSPAALRHLRDEGNVDADAGTAFGLPVEIDFGWRGEAFAVLTRERASLAEIVTSTRSGEG